MALFFSMKEALSIELGRYYRAWDWEDLQFGEVRPSTLFETADAEIDFTYRGITRTVAYKRFDPNWFFNSFPFELKAVELERDLEDPTSIAEYLTSRYGIPFEASDVAPGAKLLAAPGQHTLEISPSSPNYNANLNYVSSTIVSIGGNYDDSWPLAGSGLNEVEGRVGMANAFDYVVSGSRQYATHTTPRNEPLGLNIRAKGDFTLKFNIIPLDGALSGGNQGIFGDASGQLVGQGIFVTPDTGGLVVGCQGTRKYYNASSGAMRIGKVNEITVRGINGGFEFYLGKVLYAIIDVDDQYDAWTHFGMVGEPLTSNILIGDVLYWENAINTPVLQTQSNKQNVRMMHYVDHDWLFSSANTGRKTARKLNPAQLYYAVDFTPQAHALKTIPQKLAPWASGHNITDVPTLRKLRDALHEVDQRVTWSTSYMSWDPYNLYNCWAVFNGKTSDFNDSTKAGNSYGGYASLDLKSKWLVDGLADETFDNVLCLLLDSSTYNAGTLRVPLLIHYNDEV